MAWSIGNGKTVKHMFIGHHHLARLPAGHVQSRADGILLKVVNQPQVFLKR
jgi:hypothetical protein